MSGPKRHVFTSESVTECHPDKVADQISDAVLDAILARDPSARVACETLVTTGMAVVAGEITTSTYVHIPDLVRKTVEAIGYTDASYGFDGRTCAVCNCPLQAKTWKAEFCCPIGKWPAFAAPQLL